MSDIVPFQQEPNENDARKRQFDQLEKILIALAATFRSEITRATASLYIAALAKIPAHTLQRAAARGIQEWRFFPTVAEILEMVHKCGSDPKAHQAAYETLRDRYVREAPPVKMLPSVLDEAPAGLVPIERARRVADVLTRGQKIALGIEQPRAIDVEGRLRELRRQAKQLQTHAQLRRDSEVQHEAGIIAGLA